jgi:AraC family transcriptional regulator
MSPTMMNEPQAFVARGEVSVLLDDLLAKVRVAIKIDPAVAHHCLDRFELLWRQSAPVLVHPHPVLSNPGGLAPWQTSRVTRHIEANLTDRLSIDELAVLVRLSSNYFARAFKVSTGLSPHAYVIECRIKHAKKLLLEGDTPLSEVALDCGMADQAHLSRLFRRLVGATPSVWRRHHRSLWQSIEPQDH